MHILFLTQIIPYPPDAGPRVKTWHVLRYLAKQGHRLTLVSFVRPYEEPFIPKLKEICETVYAVPIGRSRLADIGYWLRSHVTGRPFLIERDDLKSMRKVVEEVLQNNSVDVIHADQLTMTVFAFPYSRVTFETSGPAGFQRPILIFDAHNAVWTIVERMRQNARWYLKPLAGMEAQRVKRYEGRVVREFDYTLAVADPDRRALLEAAEFSANGSARNLSRFCVVPIAVDTQALQPVRRAPGSTNIFTMGTLHYPPNADGIRWFAREVFPLIRQKIPEATLTVVGKNPPADFLQLPNQYGGAVTVTGYVADLTPHMEKAALMVVAVRAGGGMRVRILEGLARGMPVVTTTIGLEGIDARPGEEVLVADTPEDFAGEVVELLGDERRQGELAAKGRKLAEERYDWQVILGKMQEIYGPAEARANRAGSSHDTAA